MEQPLPPPGRHLSLPRMGQALQPCTNPNAVEVESDSSEDEGWDSEGCKGWKNEDDGMTDSEGYGSPMADHLFLRRPSFPPPIVGVASTAP